MKVSFATAFYSSGIARRIRHGQRRRQPQRQLLLQLLLSRPRHLKLVRNNSFLTIPQLRSYKVKLCLLGCLPVTFSTEPESTTVTTEVVTEVVTETETEPTTTLEPLVPSTAGSGTVTPPTEAPPTPPPTVAP
jgi:hypothetical protein